MGNLILLKIRPFKEENFRYLIFNEKIQSAMRLDTLQNACVLLPEDHGLIFSNGYYLQTGEYKTFRRWKVFADDSTELEFTERELRLDDAKDGLMKLGVS